MEHVLLNLVQNASTYSPESTTITVKAEKTPRLVKISIQDQGIGIDEKEFERIFERFYRIDDNRSRSQGGTGLGLSIVKHIVKLHSGWIELDSTIGHGSKFIINLPVDSSSLSE